jgi:hypothetical protein
MLVATRQKKGDMNEFGRTLNKIMVNHDVYNWTQFRERLKEETGFDLKQSRLSQWINGKRMPDDAPRILGLIRKALKLNEEENTRLVMAFYNAEWRTDRQGASNEADEPRYQGGAQNEEHRDAILDREDELRAETDIENKKDGDDSEPGGGGT